MNLNTEYKLQMDYINIALECSYLLTIQEFIEETKYDIDAFTIDRFWSNLDEDIPLYLDENLLKWCGFSGDIKTQKASLKYILLQYIEDKDYWIFTNNEYNNYFLEEERSSSKITNYPHPNTFTGRGKSTIKHIILTVACFKDIIMSLHTKKAKEVREYYLALERLYFTYTKYTIKFRDRQLKYKDDKIDLLLMQMSDVIKENKIQTHKIDIQTKNLERVLELNKNIAEKLDISTDERAPKTVSITKHGQFLLIELNDADSQWEYHVIRAQRCAANQAYKKVNKDYPECVILLKICYQPNAVNLFNLIKEELCKTRRVIEVSGNKIKLCENYGHDEFISDIKQIDINKKDV